MLQYSYSSKNGGVKQTEEVCAVCYGTVVVALKQWPYKNRNTDLVYVTCYSTAMVRKAERVNPIQNRNPKEYCR